MKKKNGLKNYLQGAALLLFLVGLPLGSWYYLDAGLKYNKELMSELKNYGRIPDFKLINQNGDTIGRDHIAGKVVVVDFFNQNEGSYPVITNYLQKLYEQFKKRKDVVFVSHTLNPSSTNSEMLRRIAKDSNLDNEHNVFLTGDTKELLKTLAKGYQIPDLKNRAEDKTIPRNDDLMSLPNEYPYFVLIDDSGTIRNYYNVHDEKSVTNLVEHLAMILPRKSEEKAELKRETEK